MRTACETVLIAFGSSLLLYPVATRAQTDSATRLDPVVVTVTRTSGVSVLGSPFALTVVRPDSARPGQRHSAVDETLALVPGLIVVNRNNPSQDPRLSIRGFGSRSTFGVRGVRVLRDGMPLTLPDGQTPLDYMSLESVGDIEVMRGAASALYGNAGGGVINFRTALPTLPLSFSARQWLGPDHSFRSAATAGGVKGSNYFNADISHSQTDGSRMQSRQNTTSGLFRIGASAASTNYSLTALALDNPLSENPGALTLSEMRADPSRADPLAVRRDARKVVKQIQVGLSAERTVGSGDAALSVFGGARSLDNPLTFSVVEVGRHSYGGSGLIHQSLSLLGLTNNFAVGADAQTQNDLRRNFSTCADTVRVRVVTATCPDPASDRGIVTLDQRELVSSAGVFATDEVVMGPVFRLTAGVRADRVRFQVRDRLITSTNPNDSGHRLLGSVSPIAGILTRYAPTHSAYLNISTAFETPTATELGNHPDGSAGINQDLNPQRSRTVEVGVKGSEGLLVSYDAALFATTVHDELVPFEIPSSNGRRYFRNAGRTTRRGAEAAGTVSQGPMSLMFAYSYSHFRFSDYVLNGNNFSGNTIPGIPSSRLQSALKVANAKAFAVFENELAGSVFVDDANATRSSAYAVSNLRGGFTLGHSGSKLDLTAGVMNLFDRHYAASIAINAANGRYYEPASPRFFFVGATIGLARLH